MADRILEISENQRYVSVQRGSVLVHQGDELLGQVPIDSLSAVILSAEGLTVSQHFLARMAENNIPVVICNKKYMPVSIALPYDAYYRSLPVVTAQLQASPVLKKQLWQRLVTAKIQNQAAVLVQCRKEQRTIDRLLKLAKTVRSGDTDNKEAQAARFYWPALLGKGFIRDRDGEGLNIFLNYGYTLLRATCARALCGSGFLPIFGIHHHNSYNAFCLADDMMEPLPHFFCVVFLPC